MTARTELKDHIQPLLSQTFGERCCSLPRKGGGDGGGWQIWEGPKASVRDNWLFLFHWQDFISKNPNPFLGSGAAVPLSLNRSTPGSEGSFGTEDRHFRFFCQRKLLERMFQSNLWGQTCRAGPWAILLLGFGWWRTRQSTRTDPCATSWSHSPCGLWKRGLELAHSQIHDGMGSPRHWTPRSPAVLGATKSIPSARGEKT